MLMTKKQDLNPLVNNQRVIDHVLRFASLRDRITWRRINKRVKTCVEEWLKRYHDKVHLSGDALCLDDKQAVRFVGQFTPTHLKLLVIDLVVSDALWTVVKERLHLAQELIFRVPRDPRLPSTTPDELNDAFAESFNDWRDRINWTQLHCTSITMENFPYNYEEDLDKMVRLLDSCPLLESVYFK